MTLFHTVSLPGNSANMGTSLLAYRRSYCENHLGFAHEERESLTLLVCAIEESYAVEEFLLLSFELLVA